MFNVNQAIEQYIIDCIDWDNYELESAPRSVCEKVRFLFTTFNSEQKHNIARYGKERAIREWLQGLPSVCSCEYRNAAIIKLAQQWEIIGDGASDSEIDAMLENYWKLIARHISELFARYCAEYHGQKFQVIAKQWRDKVNGNSYFSARIFHNGELFAIVPFQYGYGSHYEWQSARAIAEHFIDLPAKPSPGDVINLAEIMPNCKQKDAKQWGEGLASEAHLRAEIY